MNTRTTKSFSYNTDIWPVVDNWAKENSYRMKENSGSTRLYQKGRGFLVAPMMLKLTQQNGEVTLTAWIRVNTLVRLMGLFLIPSEMGIESGGIKLVAPRKIARSAVNKLLTQCQQSAIS
jgi:hypothetical protein